MALTQISTGMLASGDGTVDLNIDNGTFVVDVSTSRVGVGNTTPSVKLDITGDMKLSGAADFNGSLDVDGAVSMASTLTATGEITASAGIALPDSQKATFGASDDLQIYHDGSDSYISDVGTGDLYLQGSSNIYFRKGNGGEVFAHFADDGACRLRFDNSTKLATTSTGIDVTGNVTANPSGGVITLGASGQITSKQSLDVATAGGRFIGSSNRGVLGQIRIEQTANSTDGGYIEFDTCASGSTSPTMHMRIDSSGKVGIGTDPAARLHVKTGGSELQRWERAGNIIGFEAAAGASNGYGFYDRASSAYDIFLQNGNVSMPKQPTAVYTHSAGSEDGAYAYSWTSTGSNELICKPQLAVVNVGSIYTPSNGRFTAPVAGIYRYAVHGNLYTLGVASTAYFAIRIRKGNGHYLMHYEGNSTRAGNGWVYMNAAGLISLAANEYITFSVETNQLTATGVNKLGFDTASYTHYEFHKIS